MRTVVSVVTMTADIPATVLEQDLKVGCLTVYG